MATGLQNLRARWNPGILLVQATKGETWEGRCCAKVKCWVVPGGRSQASEAILGPKWGSEGCFPVSASPVPKVGGACVCAGVASRAPEGREGRLKAKWGSDLGIVGM